MITSSKRAFRISASATSGMAARASELRSKGVDIISLSQGEPDFKTPKHICNAAINSIESGMYFSYPPTAGYQDLREAIANKYATENDVPYGAANIVVSNGAKQAIANTMLAILNPGDEVTILAPYWVSYEAQVSLCDAIPIIVKGNAKNGFKVAIEELKASITVKTRAIIFSSPSNPTGLVYSKKELETLATLLSNYPDILVISDEIYEHINYTGERVSFASIPGMFERTITINGFGKCFAMTGWRVGYLAAPEWIAKEATKIQGHITSSNCSISQRAALAAIKGGMESVNAMTREYQERRNVVHARLQSIPDLTVNLPDGAFYFFPDVSAYYGLTYEGKQIKGSEDMCTYLLEIGHVALVPGIAFGDDACVRISYAAAMPDLIEALIRLSTALQNLKSSALMASK